MNRFFNSSIRRKGFSLVEMLISMVIFSIVMGIIYSYLLQTKKDVAESQVELNTADNAQTAINALRKDLYSIGIGRDAAHGQPQLLRAGMYDLIFVADLDRDIRNTDSRYGSLNRNVSTISFSPGSPFMPLFFLYNTGIPADFRYTGWDESASYGTDNFGAEIVRYSLDMNNDGIINNADLENNFMFGSDEDRMHTENPNDFWLNKEWWGVYKLAPGSFVNQHSGNHPVAFNLRGMFYNAQSPMPISNLNRFTYPNNQYPAPLFTYWGHFINTITANDSPSDKDWPGEPIELWGDWGGQQPMFNQPSTPDLLTGARDGVLNQNEINFLYSNTLFTQVNLNYMRAASSVVGEGEGQDWNGNGIPNEQRLDQFIRRIGVTVVTESDSPNREKPNLNRSNLSNAASPHYYFYQDYELSVQVNPRNLAYGGSPKIDLSQMTPTPQPPTPTPQPPTATPDPSLPTLPPTITPPPTPTAATTPGLYDPYDGQVAVGTNSKMMRLFCIDNDAATAEDICNQVLMTEQFVSTDTVIDMEPANFCDSIGYFDEWNDLVVATNAMGTYNLFMYRHQANTGIEGIFYNSNRIVGTEIQDQISCIEVGNVGSFGYVDASYDEVIVAYRRPGPPERVFLEVFFLNSECGDLINSGSILPALDIPTDLTIKDMLVSDFDGDGFGELVVMWNNIPSQGGSQIRYYPDINNRADGWLDFTEWFIDWGEDVECAKLIAANAMMGYPQTVEKDLIVVAENGDFRIIQNERTGHQGTLPFPTDPMVFHKPANVNFPMTNVSDAVVYNLQQFDTAYEPVLAILENSDVSEYYHMVHYHVSDPMNIFEETAGIGPIFHYATPIPPATPEYPIVQPVSMSYVPTEQGSLRNRNLIIPARLNLASYYFFAIMNPCIFSTTSLPPANCSFELSSTVSGYTASATLRSSESEFISYMPTPTPIVSATPFVTPTP